MVLPLYTAGLSALLLTVAVMFPHADVLVAGCLALLLVPAAVHLGDR